MALDRDMRSILVAMVMMAGANAASADKCDTSKEANVRGAFKQATGGELPKNGGCVRMSETFPGLVWVGSFADDRGCERTGVLVGCEMSPKGYQAKAMEKAGWAKADQAGKEKLAWAWLREIDDYSLVNDKPDRFQGTWTAPTLEVGKDGSAVAEFWTRDPSGMRPVSVYRLQRVTFAAEGTHSDLKEIKQVTIGG
jgi:hypothetical protein